ncbi:MAG: hypothetical protein EHM35_00825 [Planctomycetaceae bacterium]|nr:MAG: hypothetical protein EHM35_00825 [Planctomycetaceae bacterium]
MIVLTIEQLNEALAWWKPYLGLSDWEVQIFIVSCADMDGNALARSRTRAHHKELDIEIGTWESRCFRSRNRCDMELDLVHEMMHSVFNPLMLLAGESLDGGILEDLALEQPVEMLARSMIRLRRLSGPHFSWEQATQAGRLEAEARL